MHDHVRTSNSHHDGFGSCSAWPGRVACKSKASSGRGGLFFRSAALRIHRLQLTCIRGYANIYCTVATVRRRTKYVCIVLLAVDQRPDVATPRSSADPVPHAGRSCSALAMVFEIQTFDASRCACTHTCTLRCAHFEVCTRAASCSRQCVLVDVMRRTCRMLRVHLQGMAESTYRRHSYTCHFA